MAAEVRDRAQIAHLYCGTQRLYQDESVRAPYLISIHGVHNLFCGIVSSMSQARATVDDFGTLIVVESFK